MRKLLISASRRIGDGAVLIVRTFGRLSLMLKDGFAIFLSECRNANLDRLKQTQKPDHADFDHANQFKEIAM